MTKKKDRSINTARQLIMCFDVSRVYGKGETRVLALKNVSFELAKGTFTAILGPSGSGKSTLMNILGCLDNATSGKYFLNGKSPKYL